MPNTLSINPPFELLAFQWFGIVLCISTFANWAPRSWSLPPMLNGEGFADRAILSGATDDRTSPG
jgi:hypothetical protein